MLRKRGRRRRRSRLSVAALIIVCIALAIPTGAGALLVKNQADSLQTRLIAQVEAGQTELEAAKSSLKEANSKRDLAGVSAAKMHFTSAQSHFAAARQLADGSLFLHGLEAVPVGGAYVSSRHTAVDGIALMGIALCDAGQSLADLDAQLLKPGAGNGQQGQAMLTVLNQLQGKLPAIRAALKRADTAAGSIDINLVPSGQRATLTKARDTIETGLSTMVEVQQLIPVLIDILGGNGARSYLVEQVNPAELRPGGGFIGSYTLLKADHGSLTIAQAGNSYDLANRVSPGQHGYVTPPGPLKEFVPTVGWSFVDSNFFADFPSNAKAAEQFVDPVLKSSLDGVIAMDYYTVAAILKLTGPMTVPEFSVTVTADNLVSTLIQFDLGQTYIHKAILSSIAGQLFQRILTMSPGEWPNMLSTLTDAATQRHLQIYFNNPAAEAAMDRYGLSGVLNPTHAADCMLEEESNLGGTKANYFVTRSYTVRLTRVGEVLHHEVTVDVTDNMPHFPGNAYYAAPGTYYHAYMRLYACGSTSAATDNLVKPKYPSPSAPAGMSVLDGWLPAIAGGGGHGRATFAYDTRWTADAEGAAHIYWQKEPGTTDDKIQVTWLDATNGGSYTASGVLNGDLEIDLGTSGVTVSAGHPSQASIPSISLG